MRASLGVLTDAGSYSTCQASTLSCGGVCRYAYRGNVGFFDRISVVGQISEACSFFLQPVPIPSGAHREQVVLSSIEASKNLVKGDRLELH